jgi:TrmH family RNA methyltransferase
MKGTIKPYKKNFDYSYTSGAFITIELLRSRPEQLGSVYIHSAYGHSDQIKRLCAQNGIACTSGDAVFRRINQKENSYVLGVFKKYPSNISHDESHVVLVNPSDMGNLGTIIRTLVGFNTCNLAVINPSADIWNPRTIRASMGAFFHMNFQHLTSIDEYLRAFPKHQVYTFMLNGEMEARPENIPKEKPFSLVFGNEATGLDENFCSIGTSIAIPQSPLVDSLNLSTAVAVCAYLFTL